MKLLNAFLIAAGATLGYVAVSVLVWSAIIFGVWKVLT